MSIAATSPTPAFSSHRHIALVYDGGLDYVAATAAFIGEGLTRNNHALFVHDAGQQSVLLGPLSEAGFDVAGSIASGQLAFAETADTFLPGGSFNPDEMLAALGDAVGRAAEGGFAGLFVAGDMSWALSGATGVDDLDRYEQHCTAFFAGNPAVALCQYDRRRLRDSALLRVLLTHPWILIDGHLCRNHHNLPDGESLDDHGELLAGIADAPSNVDAMLADLVVREAAERTVAGTTIAIEGPGDLPIRLEDASRLARIYSELVLFKSQVLARSEARLAGLPSARARADHSRNILQLRGELAGLKQRLDFWQDRVRRAVGLDYDAEERRVRYGERSVRLSRRESQLVAALISQNGRSLAARELLWRAWGGNHLSEAQVRTYVVQLRKKLASLEMPAALILAADRRCDQRGVIVSGKPPQSLRRTRDWLP